MQMKRVFAGGFAALAAGALAFAPGALGQSTSLGDFVKTSDGSLASPMVVIGNPAALGSGYPMDVVGAADIAAAVAGYATTPVAAGGGTGGSVSGGVLIDTPGTRLYFGDAVDKSGLKSTLTKSDLPTLLTSGTFTDDEGTNYQYDQYITLDNAYPEYTTSGGDLTDPTLHLNMSSSIATPVVNLTVTFNKPMNLSDEANIYDGNAITLFGNKYTVAPASEFISGNRKLVLFGSSNLQTLKAGESKEITIDGSAYTVELVGASSATVAVVKVGPETKSVTKGMTTKVGGLDVYVDDVFYLSSTDASANSAQLSFGSSKLTLEDGVTAKKGSSDDTVDGTIVFLTGTNNVGLTKLIVSFAASSSAKDNIESGSTFTDPIFGTKLAFGGISDSGTETITIDNSGSTGASLKFTDYRGNTNSVIFSYTATNTFVPDLNASSNDAHIVIEGATVKRNDYLWLAPSQQSDFGHVMRITSVSSLGTTSAQVELQDVWAATSQKIYLTDTGYGTGNFYVDGQQYFINNISSSAQTFNITWDSGAAVGTGGTKLTVFPLVRTSKGGWVTIAGTNATSNATVNTTLGNSTIELPTGDLIVQYGNNNVSVFDSNGQVVVPASGVSVGATLGRMKYLVNVVNVSNGATGFTSVTLPTTATGTTPIAAPSWLFVEENAKNTASPEADVKDVVYGTVRDGTGSGVDTDVGATPILTAGTQSATATWSSDNSVTSFMDRRGTVVKYDTDGQGLVEVWYPDEQAIALVAVGSAPVVSTSGSAGTVDQAVKITAPVAKLASEVNTAALTGDLILVGGPCANSLVAQLADNAANGIQTCAAWSKTTGIIKEVANAFGSGKKALVVAGTQGTDTRALAAKVMQGTLSFDA